jgi:hypothetical protein
MAGEPPSPEPTQPTQPPRRRWGVGRIVVLVLGILAALLALAFLGGGGTLLWADQTQRDADDFVSTDPQRFSSDAYAILSESIDIDEDIPDWLLSEDVVGSVRVQAEDAEDDEIFLGLGPTTDVRRYLAGVGHAVVRDLHYDPFRATYRHVDGGAPRSPPGDETFWTADASGPGEQTLEWDLEQGDWSLVLMNADGSAGVAADVSAGAEAPFLTWLAVVLIVLGVLLLGAAALLMYLVFRPAGPGAGGATALEPAEGVTTLEPAAAPVYPVAVRGDLDPDVSRWLWVLKWLLVLPHVLVLVFLWIAFWVLWLVAFFAILFTGRYPRGIFDFNVGVLRWTWRVLFYSYWALGTDRYPPFTLDPDPAYPADLGVEYPERLSRGLVLVKWWLLAIPQYALVAIFVGWWTWGSGWWGDGHWGWWWGGSAGLVGLLVFFAAIALVFTGRYPRGIFELALGLDRWVWRVAAYVSLMRDEYPPFRLDPGPREPAAAAEPEPPPSA